MNLIDLIFPRKCLGCRRFGSYLCRECLAKIDYLETQICSYCYKAAIAGKTHPYCWKKNGLDGIVSFVNYKSPIKEFILQIKYRFVTALTKEVFEKMEFKADLIPEGDWILIPLPLHKSRENYRGFNQAAILGKLIAERLNFRVDNQFLERSVNTKPQVGLSKSERKQNIANTFKVNKSLVGENYFIFDDVWTSGASLKSAALELKKAGAKSVWGLTLAHPR